jgi:hypothetical protein
MPTTEYRVLFGNILDGTIEGEVEVHDLQYSEMLTPPGAMSCWMSMDDVKALRGNIDPGATAMYIERGGLLVWGGILWTAKADSLNRKLSLSCTDFWSYFRRRRLRTTKTYTSQDQLFIARDLINYCQAQPLGNVNIIVGTETSPIAVSKTYYHYERHNIAQAIEDLSDKGTGFAISVDVTWDSSGTTPIRTLRLYYPRRGSRIEGLVFNHNIQGISNFENDVDASSIANIIDAIGSGDGEGMLIATGVDSTNLGRYPLYEDTISLKDEKDQLQLQSAANWSVGWRSSAAEVPSITKDPQIWPDFGSFQPGDEGLVVARSGPWLDLYGYHQILGWEITRSDQGKEQMKIDMVMA